MTRILSPVIAAVLALLLGSCHHIDNHRLNVGSVNLTFSSQGIWDFYGVSGAGQYKTYIREERIPADFPYTAMMSTGVGGILLCTTYLGTPVAYDLACPVECSAKVRVHINENNEAECAKCGSRYDVFEQLGRPISGRAAEQGWGLQLYNVGPGPRNEYMMVSL